jgi:hypothetical protein
MNRWSAESDMDYQDQQDRWEPTALCSRCSSVVYARRGEEPDPLCYDCQRNQEMARDRIAYMEGELARLAQSRKSA